MTPAGAAALNHQVYASRWRRGPGRFPCRGEEVPTSPRPLQPAEATLAPLKRLARDLLLELAQREEWKRFSADGRAFALRYAAALLEDKANPRKLDATAPEPPKAWLKEPV